MAKLLDRDAWYDEKSRAGLRAAIQDCAHRGVAVEFGSWQGTSTLILAEYFSRVLAVDPWKPLPGGSPHYENVEQAYAVFCERTAGLPVTRFRCADAEFMEICDGPVDFVHIDAEHTFDAVDAAIRWALSVIHPGGVIAGHDITHPDDWFPGVRRAVAASFSSWKSEDIVWWVPL